MRHIKGPQDKCLQHTEDDDVGGDPQRQGEDRRNGKAGRAAHLAKREAQVLQQVGHGRPLGDDLATWNKRNSRAKDPCMQLRENAAACGIVQVYGNRIGCPVSAESVRE